MKHLSPIQTIRRLCGPEGPRWRTERAALSLANALDTLAELAPKNTQASKVVWKAANTASHAYGELMMGFGRGGEAKLEQACIEARQIVALWPTFAQKGIP